MIEDKHLWKLGRYKLNLDKEEDFKRSHLWKLFKIVFSNEKEAVRAYRLLKVIKKEPQGFRLYGNKWALTRAVRASLPTVNSTLEKMEELGLVESVSMSSNVAIRKRLPKEETGLTEDLMLPREQKRKSKLLVISDSTKFVNTIALALEDWIEFKKPPLTTTLVEELGELEKEKL